MAKVKAPRKKTANGYKMPDPLPLGEVLQDMAKKEWRLGPSIGKGGFGEIYSAQAATSSGSKYPYVIKIEPHGNGPLFVEMHFYMRNCKQEDIEYFKKEYKLKNLGLPPYLGSGSHEHGKDKYRFIVTEKFGDDIEKIFQQSNCCFSIGTVFKLALQVINILEYIHQRGYIHADIKGANILMGITENNKHQAHLVDFGLVSKFTIEKEYKPNPKKAHDGTAEFLSRDAHDGVPTRRGDLEILAYNIIYWLGGKLPWNNCLNDVNAVQKSKQENMKNISNFIKTAFSEDSPPDVVPKFLKYVDSLSFHTQPDYGKIRKMFVDAIKASGESADDKLHIKLESNGTMKRKNQNNSETVEKKSKVTKAKRQALRKIMKTVHSSEEEDDDFVEQVKKSPKEKKTVATKKNKPKNEVAPISELTGITPAMAEILSKRINKKTDTKKKKDTVLNEIPSTSTRNRTLRNGPKVDYTDF